MGAISSSTPEKLFPDMNMRMLEGNAAVITGGASGIGRAGVKLFVKHGARVVIADIDAERGNRLAEELGASVVYIQTDVRDEAQVKAALSLSVERFGRLDCLWNNAGVAAQSPPAIEEIPLDRFDHIMSVSLRGVVLGMKVAAPIMKKQKTGNIITTASVAGIRTGFASHLYSAAKAAVIQLTRSVAMELGESGIRVNCICPSGIATPIFGGKLAGLSQCESEKRMQRIEAFISGLNPMKRACSSEDVAQAALWLASDAAGFVNGHALVIDGGVTGGRLWSTAQEERIKLQKALEMVVPEAHRS